MRRGNPQPRKTPFLLSTARHDPCPPPQLGGGRVHQPRGLTMGLDPRSSISLLALWDTSVLSQLSLSFGFLLKRAPWEGVRVWQRLKLAPNFYFFFFLRTSLDTPPHFKLSLWPRNKCSTAQPPLQLRWDTFPHSGQWAGQPPVLILLWPERGCGAETVRLADSRPTSAH